MKMQRKDSKYEVLFAFATTNCKLSFEKQFCRDFEGTTKVMG